MNSLMTRLSRCRSLKGFALRLVELGASQTLRNSKGSSLVAVRPMLEKIQYQGRDRRRCRSMGSLETSALRLQDVYPSSRFH